MKKILLLLLVLSIMSCVGEDNEGQDFGDIFDSDEGLILTEEEHPDGWGRSECFVCHPIFDIHQVDRSGIGILPLEEIQEFVVEEGLPSCPICHGDNGVDK
ncbi:hypothetical protein MYX76_10645 [Desulfobacterota bacterium AH_259_B03_O07]|nr:hypothetical protein [Desulfobacterota bacterium AH_259_B03_O07]